MTRTDVLRAIGGLMWLLVFAMLAADKRIIRRLRAASANSPQSATTLTLRSPLARFRLARMQRAGAVRDAGAGLMYLDPAGFEQYRRRRRRRALKVLVVVIPSLLLLWWYSGVTTNRDMVGDRSR